jgi:hypothetical protein
MQMGIGNVGSPGVIMKRKFRWTMNVQWANGTIDWWYVKVAARPKLAVESTEIPFLNATTWLPGKAKWEPIQVTYRDVAGAGAGDMTSLYNWILSIYNFNDKVNLPQNEKKGWNGQVFLTLYDGCGMPLEQWTLDSCYPEMIDFGGLDYGSNDEVTIDLTLRYSEVEYKGLANCNAKPSNDCQGC